MKNTSGCLVFIFIVLAVLAIVFGIDILLTKFVIWVADQLFNIDWSDKFWTVFIVVFVFTNISFSFGKNK
ncbi:MAG: hypothetical protein SPL72_08690 [Cyanobacteriota bacterium]|nr:hypothetical protein [Cyanobacteriota bacterium]